MDLLIVPCDLVSTIPIHELLDVHISNHSTLTMLLVCPDESQIDDPSKKMVTHNTGTCKCIYMYITSNHGPLYM